jgi:Putative Actinobacterial Holin-X, holin superfamily III
MPNQSQHPAQHLGEPSLAALIGSIINDAKDLLLHEFTMAKLEVQDELNKTKTAAISLGVGAGIAAVGSILLILMLVHLLQAFTDIPLWGCYGIIGALLLALGIGLLLTGKKTAQEIDVIPQQTVDTIKENAQWIKEQTTSTKL